MEQMGIRRIPCTFAQTRTRALAHITSMIQSHTHKTLSSKCFLHYFDKTLMDFLMFNAENWRILNRYFCEGAKNTHFLNLKINLKHTQRSIKAVHNICVIRPSILGFCYYRYSFIMNSFVYVVFVVSFFS